MRYSIIYMAVPLTTSSKRISFYQVTHVANMQKIIAVVNQELHSYHLIKCGNTVEDS